MPQTQITMTTLSSSSQVNLNKNEPSSDANKEVTTPSKKLTPKKKSSKKHKSVLQTKLHHLSMQIGYIGNEIILRISKVVKKTHFKLKNKKASPQRSSRFSFWSYGCSSKNWALKKSHGQIRM